MENRDQRLNKIDIKLKSYYYKAYENPSMVDFYLKQLCTLYQHREDLINELYGDKPVESIYLTDEFLNNIEDIIDEFKSKKSNHKKNA